MQFGEGGIERTAVGLEIEPEPGCGDDVEVETIQREATVLAELCDAIA